MDGREMFRTNEYKANKRQTRAEQMVESANRVRKTALNS